MLAKGKYILLAILFIGLLLRCLSISWGLPISFFASSYHPDEAKFYRSVYAFPENYLVSRDYFYGTACQYFLGVLLLPLKILVVWLRILPGEGFYFVLCVLVSRFFGILTGTTTIYLGYLITEKLFDRKTALISASFISVSFYHCMNSSFSTLDVPMSFLLLLNFFVCMRAFDTGELKDYALLGIISGLLLGTKIVGGLFVIIPVVLSFSKIFTGHDINKGCQNGSKNRLVYLKELLIYISVTCAAFVITTPHIFLHFQEYWNFMMDQKAYWFDANQGGLFKAVYQWSCNTRLVVGLPVMVLFLIGIAKYDKEYWVYKFSLLLILLFYYSFWRGYLIPRFIITVAPIFCIFAARGCVSLIEASNKTLRYTGMAVFATAIIFSAYFCIEGIDMRFNDTRNQAAKYIAERIPKGESIGIGITSEVLGWRNHKWCYPRIDSRKYKWTFFLDKPTIVILSSYDFRQIETALRSPKLSDGYRWDDRYAKDWYLFSPPSPRLFKFYDELLNNKTDEYVLIKSFKPKGTAPIEFAPPEIRIYHKIKVHQ